MKFRQEGSWPRRIICERCYSDRVVISFSGIECLYCGSTMGIAELFESYLELKKEIELIKEALGEGEKKIDFGKILEEQKKLKEGLRNTQEVLAWHLRQKKRRIDPGIEEVENEKA